MAFRLSITFLLFVILALPSMLFLGMTDMGMEHHSCPISFLLNGQCVGDDVAALLMVAHHLAAWKGATWAAMAGVIMVFAASLIVLFLWCRVFWKPSNGQVERSSWQVMRRRTRETASCAFEKLHHWLALHNKRGSDLADFRAQVYA